jgi:hypothetical protein
MKRFPGVVLFVTSVFASCTLFSPYIVEAPLFVRERAFDEATRYIGMEYELGRQDFPKGIDCSGLLVNVYYTATRGIDYRLRFTDTAFSHLLFFHASNRRVCMEES